MGINNGFPIMFTIMPFLFFFIFSIVVIMFVVFAVKGLKQWHYNNSQPVLKVPAKIVSKRVEVRNNMHHTNGAVHGHASTTYYVTFEVESGSRIELQVYGKEYGLLAEGDFGNLQFQGTRYLSFDRIPA